ncbi:MAG: hypothetical protein HYS14_03920 [Candidatus Rokubacteria bacterium]|nr:hypothetical protein [Candidatus Rokubacteria bacterium]
MRRTAFVTLALVLGVGILATTVAAEPLKIVEMNLSKPQQIRIDFPLVGAEKHLNVLKKSEGVVPEGSTWASAKAQEVGYHDVYPGDNVWGTGYLTFTLPNGDQVSMKHEFSTRFLPAADGKLAPVEHGVWTIIGGTGKLAGIRGVGRFQIRRTPADPNVRIWDLTGDMAVVKP